MHELLWFLICLIIKPETKVLLVLSQKLDLMISKTLFVFNPQALSVSKSTGSLLGKLLADTLILVKELKPYSTYCMSYLAKLPVSTLTLQSDNSNFITRYTSANQQ